ncbi:MAG: hypothetical protein KF780_07600 [Sphingomonas sp.]|nr:hypothetical protein [Sphingomonas sp.]
MRSRSEKLPKGRSYPLKPSLLEAAVADSGLSLPVELTQWDRFDHAFQADFLPNGWPKRAEHELIWVHCRAVPSERAAESRAKMEQEIIPRFIQWAQDIEAHDLASPVRREKQIFRASLDDWLR